MTMMNRVAPDASPLVALTQTEKQLLGKLVPNTAGKRQPAPLSRYLTAVAQLGGYLARRSDPPPGNMVMWRGLSRLTDIELGFFLGAKLVGN